MGKTLSTVNLIRGRSSSFAGLFTRLRLEPGHHLQGFARLQISLARGREVGIELWRRRDLLGKFRRCAKLLDERIDPRMQPSASG